MKLNTQIPKITLNKAFLKQRPLRSEIEVFKANLKNLLEKVKLKESEENKKNHVRDFLLDTYYKGKNEINTKDRKDLVIHLGETNQTKVGVIIEAKSPDNKAEMLRQDKLNTKAFHELVLYYFDERQAKDNAELKNLIVTNSHEWFIFDANEFDKKIYRNTAIRNLYQTYKNDKKDNLFFYEEIRKLLDNSDDELNCAYFNLKNYETFLYNADLEDDKNLIELFKILSPFHLLKIPFANDSNALNKPFYDELLHIIGLEEIKDKSKTIIQRKDESRRTQGSLLENAITILKTKDSLRRVKDIANYGETTEERYFNVALELCITWINRILFLKLLESQLVIYHKGNADYKFLNIFTIPDFDELFTLFHQVLAKTFDDRETSIKEKYKRVPYLNSSLFEISDLEDATISIESVKANVLPFTNSTILKDLKGQGKTLTTLEYMFRFLDAYDFASEGAEDVQADNRSLINASVLGKVFEKINGYKDGSIFTPAFITMYMCRQAIRLAVVQKFKDKYAIDIDTFADLQNFVGNTHKTEKILEYNALINEIHLCDPAVGSGHFLVSSLNEIIAIKSELGLFADEKGVRFSEYQIVIENDELIITDEKGDIFEYQINDDGKPTARAQKLQKALFHEKQTLIENCLFGVDINPNSVKICRLRLWIELLKNAYYKESSGFAELETLPNIDINIKCGNSLLSRFKLDDDLSEVLKTLKYNIEDYKNFVLGYKETRDREKKREFEQKIKQIKDDFRVELNHFSPERKQLAKLKNELFEKQSKQFLFGEDEDKQKERLKRIEELKFDIDLQNQKIKEIEENIIFRNAFEWRFEFPEVLDNEGNFLGFDIVIGNPPYIVLSSFSNKEFLYYQDNYPSTYGRINTWAVFVEKIKQIVNHKFNCSLIIPDSLCQIDYYTALREFCLDNYKILEIIELGDGVFEEAIVPTIIFTFKDKDSTKTNEILIGNENAILTNNFYSKINQDYYHKTPKKSFNLHLDDLAIKMQSLIDTKLFAKLSDIAQIKIGVCTGNNKKYISDKPIFENSKKLLQGKDIHKYILTYNNLFINYDRKQLLRARDEEIFLKPEKLLMRQTSDKLILTYDNEQFYTIDSLFIIYEKDVQFNLKYLLAVLNSKLLHRQYQKLNPESGRVFAQVKIDFVNELPMPKVTPEEQKPFIELVDEILEKKKLGQETADLENKIDEMVYRLYDLTEEEIAIVEGKK